MRVVYNNKKLYKYKKKELKIIQGELKKVKNINVERMKIKTNDFLPNKKELEYVSLVRAVFNTEGIEKAQKEKKRIFIQIKKMLNYIKSMSLVEYIQHLKEIVEEKMKKERKKKEKRINEMCEENMIITTDEEDVAPPIINEILVEQKINKLLELKKVDKNIRYRIRF